MECLQKKWSFWNGNLFYFFIVIPEWLKIFCLFVFWKTVTDGKARDAIISIIRRVRPPEQCQSIHHLWYYERVRVIEAARRAEGLNEKRKTESRSDEDEQPIDDLDTDSDSSE